MNVEKWVQEVREITKPNISVVVAGNKRDLVDCRQVSEEDGEKLAKKLGLQVLETSAMTGENVNHLFTALVKGVLDQIDQAEIPLSEVRNKLTGDLNKQVPQNERIVSNDGCSC